MTISKEIESKQDSDMTPTCSHKKRENSSVKYTDLDANILETTKNLLSAMADESRLKILIMLDEGNELCVSEIADVLDDKVNTISMRLKKLYDAGIVSKRREAKHIYYRLRDEHVVTIVHNAIEHAKHM